VVTTPSRASVRFHAELKDFLPAGRRPDCPEVADVNPRGGNLGASYAEVVVD